MSNRRDRQEKEQFRIDDVTCPEKPRAIQDFEFEKGIVLMAVSVRKAADTATARR
jgi:hypothetical protein